MNVRFPTGGGAEIDGKKLGDKQLEALVQAMVQQGLLPHYAASVATVPTVRQRLDAFVTAVEARDRGAALRAMTGVGAALFDLCNVVEEPVVTTARVPTAEDVSPTLRRALRLQKDFPLATMPAYRDPAEVEAQAAQLEAQIELEGQLSAEATLVGRNVVATSQAADRWLRNLWALCQAARATTPGLGEASAFLDSYFTEAASRAQVTRQIVDRVKSETVQETREAVYKEAKAEAREELRSELDERFQALLDK